MSRQLGSQTATGCSRRLQEHGLPARPLGEVEIEVPLDDDDAGDEVYSQVEKVVMTLGAPFVPIKHEGVIYVRPPVG